MGAMTAARLASSVKDPVLRGFGMFAALVPGATT